MADQPSSIWELIGTALASMGTVAAAWAAATVRRKKAEGDPDPGGNGTHRARPTTSPSVSRSDVQTDILREISAKLSTINEKLSDIHVDMRELNIRIEGLEKDIEKIPRGP